MSARNLLKPADDVVTAKEIASAFSAKFGLPTFADTQLVSDLPRQFVTNTAERFLPDLVLESGQRHFASLDSNKNGYVSKEELGKFLAGTKFSRSLGAEDRKALQEMSDKYEQIQRSSRDEFWYKDRKGITLKDLREYNLHQWRNHDKMPNTPGDHKIQLTIGGVNREARIHIPPGADPSTPMPVVYAFHYFTGSPKEMAEYSQLDAKADREKFVVVYPSAVGWAGDRLRQWNLDNKPTYRVDEVAFVSQLMDKVERDIKVDKSRVYVAGYSNGGMLAHELATKMPERIAAVAVVSGCLNGNERKPDKPVPALLIHGTEDSLVPYEGRRFTPLFPRMRSLSFCRDFWKSANQTDNTAATEVAPGVTKECHTSSRTGAEVVVYTLKGHGHGWPGSTGSIDGKECMRIKGADVVWDFFAKHNRIAQR